MADPRSLNPTVEDYQSSDDDSGVVTESFHRRASPASANVAAKRSKSSEMGADKATESKKEERLPPNIDLQSDSGYSSHTAATMSSADSAPSAKSQSPPVAAAHPLPPSSPTLKKRPTLSSRKKEVAVEERDSPRKPLGRTGSVSSRHRERRPTRGQADAERECTVPDCTKCGPNATSNAASSRGRPTRPAINPISTGANSSYDAQSRVSSDPSTYHVPPSPSHSRPPSYYGHGSTVIQPGMPRRSSSTSRNARPMSYHGGEAGQGFPGWPMPNQLPSPPQDVPGRGPPPAGSAYWSMQHNPQMHHYGATPPSNGYYSQPAAPYYSPPYEQPQHSRPPLTHQTQSFSARGPQGPSGRPLSQYNTVINQQEFPGGERRPGPSARYHDPPPSATRSKFEESSSDEYESSSEEEYEEDHRSRVREAKARELMPPPVFKPKAHRRESIGMSQSMMLPERHRERDPKVSRVSTTTTSSRAPSRSRPKVLQQKAQTTYDVPTRNSNRNSQVYVEDPKSSRRQSYMGYEDQAELKQKHRNSKIYSHEVQAEPKARRRQTQTEYDPPSRRREQELDDRMDGINAYMSQTRGNENPYTDQIINAAKRASTRVSNPSENGSRRSRHSDDNKTRLSRTTSANNAGGGGEIRLKLALDSTPLNLEFKGDMEGRTLQINPADDGSGMAELVIGQKETVYRSERGSVAGSEGRRKLIANNARREAEERSSVRSAHSSQGRRARDGESRADDRERRRRVREGTYYEH
ncbi:hypothetical protein BDV96DRAFT_647694 [Lophiotrema nucula]|uniref:Uncharacterized protein n=1 Tax=Lophiotrema nucula TaxID=690887 RepID=A0A6A5Z414_9PLEO|nr:hypothetical protein BDV96DRAFT_647694 [Lophiotrema nucula]